MKFALINWVSSKFNKLTKTDPKICPLTNRRRASKGNATKNRIWPKNKLEATARIYPRARRKQTHTRLLSRSIAQSFNQN